MDLEVIRQFVKVVQNGSFTKAADSLRVPKSTLSKAVSGLEKETGTKLLLRTTRSLTLTAAGRAFYETCLSAVQTLEEAQKSLYGNDTIISGKIKLTAPEDLGSTVIAPAIGILTRKYPSLRFELIYTDEILDLVKDGYDLAIRIGKLSESALKVKRLGDLVLIPVASPDYLKSANKIRHPKDLEQHSCLAITSNTANKNWSFKSGKETATIKVHPRIESNLMSSLLQSAIAGAGVAFVPGFLAKKDLKTGDLVRILPEWSGAGIPVSLLSPLAMTSSARLKIVSETIFEEVRKALT
jgi:DNA-binding transcriptional LysR family regulator